LAVNNFTQYSLRELLEKHDEVLPHQLGKPIKNPTAQSIFTILSTIAVTEIILVDKKISIVTNMQPLHKKIISFFGPAANKIYDIPINLKPEDVVLNKKIG
jgi:hypothetical protein